MRGNLARLLLIVGCTQLGFSAWGASGEIDRAADARPLFATMDLLVAQRLDESSIPGAVYGVVIDGELAHVAAFGYRDVDERLEVKSDTIFRIASMSKSFTSLAILLLRDDGALSLDDPVELHVPEMKGMPLPTRDSGPVTIRHLLTHTAGFPEDNPWGDRQLEVDHEEFSRWLADGIPFSTAPGAAYEYSNTGFAILGRVVANVSGMPYAEFVQQRILDPLEMTSTFWNVEDVPPSRAATGYSLGGGHAGFAPGDPEGELSIERPLGDGAYGSMGGAFTDARDLGRWVALMLSAFPPRDDRESGPALRRTLREMQRGSGYPALSVTREHPAATLDAGASVYAYGLGVTQTCEFDRIVGHSGGLPGFGSNMRWSPETGVGVFLMANLTYAPTGAIVSELLELLHRNGVMEQRDIAPAPALVDASAEVFRLIDDWDDGVARNIAANNLFRDRSLELRRADIVALREGLGHCEQGELVPDNALRGNFRMTCEGGWLDVRLTLAPTAPPRVQYLRVKGGHTPSGPMERMIDELVVGLHSGQLPFETAESLEREALGARLRSVRDTYGSCSRDELLEGDGESRTSVRLHCDRGDVDMTVVLEGNKLASVDFTHSAGQRCVP